MKAMILAAGLGTRMRPLTDHTPKPMLKAGGKSLLEHHLLNLRTAGITDIVINVSWLADCITKAFGSGESLGLNICYSHESSPLETAGGIVKAMPLLADEQPYILVVNGDIWTDFSLAALVEKANAYTRQPQMPLAHLVLADNPPHHPKGDFCLDDHEQVHEQGEGLNLTFSGISLLHRDLFKGQNEQAGRLAPLLRHAMKQEAVRGEHFQGQWWDIGTPERLEALDILLQQAPTHPKT